MQGMIDHHAQALEMVALLNTRTAREDMKRLGQRIAISQSDEIAAMKAWLGERGVAGSERHHGADAGAMAHDGTAPLMPGMLSAAQMAALAQARGPAFDRLFLEGMIRHHEGALVMVEALFASPGAGEEPTIFDFATHVDADQRIEIGRMRQMLEDIR
jgi:uncharacterized protein (DUF305 family)